MTDGKKSGRALTFAEIKGKARRRESVAVVCLAGDLSADAERLTVELEAVKARPGIHPEDAAERARLESELDEVRQLMKSSEVELRFRALPPQEYSDLVAAHPSDDPDQAFDAESFDPALVAACSLEPRMTVAEVNELYENLNRHSRSLIWSAAWRACNGAVSVPS